MDQVELHLKTDFRSLIETLRYPTMHLIKYFVCNVNRFLHSVLI
jgi:hypothetical protein